MACEERGLWAVSVASGNPQTGSDRALPSLSKGAAVLAEHRPSPARRGVLTAEEAAGDCAETWEVCVNKTTTTSNADSKRLTKPSGTVPVNPGRRCAGHEGAGHRESPEVSSFSFPICKMGTIKPTPEACWKEHERLHVSHSLCRESWFGKHPVGPWSERLPLAFL